MHYCNQESTLEDELNKLVDKILAEDQRERRMMKCRNRDRNVYNETEELQKNKNLCRKQAIGVFKSKRFSLYVFEAMRALQREKKNGSKCSSNFSTTCEIVDYIKSNFPSDGDLEAQVRTTLKRSCSQGFVKYEGKDKYHLIGPLANHLNHLRNLKKRNCTHSCSNTNTTQSSNNTQECSETNFSSTSSIENYASKTHQTVKKKNNKVQTEPSMCNIDEKSIRQSRCYSRTRKSRENSRDRRCSKTSSAWEEGNNVVGCIDNPAQEIEAGIHPTGIVEPNDTEKSIESCEEGDNDSDDSVLRELTNNAKQKPENRTRNRELRRWIRNCRLECARQAFHEQNQSSQE